MTYHTWGDKDFDWDALQDAMDYIFKMTRRATTLIPRMKEKYGTIRYEGMVLTEEMIDAEYVANMDTFLKIVKRATKKFPQVAPEIIDDLWALAGNSKLTQFKLQHEDLDND